MGVFCRQADVGPYPTTESLQCGGNEILASARDHGGPAARLIQQADDWSGIYLPEYEGASAELEPRKAGKQSRSRNLPLVLPKVVLRDAAP